MLTRTWPYGTRKAVEVVSFERCRNAYVIACRHLDDPQEATLIVCHASAVIALFHKPQVGQQRVIEFRDGGPTGGHWALLDGLDVTRAEPVSQPGGK